MPIYAGVGISSNRDYKLAVSEAISQAKIDLKKREVSLGIVFSSPEFAFPYILKTITNLIGYKIPLLGATSNAILTGDRITNQGIAIALISTEKAYFNTASVKNVSKDLKASGENLGKQLLAKMKGVSRCFALYFCDGLIADPLPFLKGLQQRFGLSFPVIGAISSSDDIHLNKTYQYFNYEVLNNSIVGLLWTGKISFGIGVRHGWRPLGKPRTISSSERSEIKKIENRPAVSLYQDYFAKEIPELKRELKSISCLYPVGIDTPFEPKEYLLRSILSIKEDGSLVCRGDIPVNNKARLMIATPNSCLLATKEAAREAKQALAMQTSPKQVSPNIVFVFNSVSRLYLLKRQVAKELEIIRSEFPETPVIGLYTYGEQAPLKATGFRGQTYCHNQTIVILAIS